MIALKSKNIISFILVLMLAASIAAIPASASAASLAPTATTTITTRTANDTVHLRSGPGTSYDSYGLLQKGEYFFELSENNGWAYGCPSKNTAIYQFYNEYKFGYVYSQYLD